MTITEQTVAATTGRPDGRAHTPPVVVEVIGLPAPQGSKKGFLNKHTGKVSMTESSSRVRPWREAVKQATLDVLQSAEAPAFGRGTAVGVMVTFLLPRPASHFRTGANATLLRDAAPAWPAGRPDVDKLLRSTLDALGEAGVWHDDSQVVEVLAVKRYGTRPGARIAVSAL